MIHKVIATAKTSIVFYANSVKALNEEIYNLSLSAEIFPKM